MRNEILPCSWFAHQLDIAQTEVQNRLSTVEARLPVEVRRQGITVRQANAADPVGQRLPARRFEQLAGKELASRQCYAGFCLPFCSRCKIPLILVG